VSLKTYIKEQYVRAMVKPEDLIPQAQQEATKIVQLNKDEAENAWNNLSRAFDLQQMIWKSMDMIRLDGKKTGEHWIRAVKTRNAKEIQTLLKGLADELNDDCQESIHATLNATKDSYVSYSAFLCPRGRGSALFCACKS